MLDTLTIWGVTTAVGFAFKPILEELAKDAGNAWVKDMFKKSLSSVFRLPDKEPLDKAAGKALKEFLALFQQELEFADLDEDEVRHYLKPLREWLKNKSVREILGSGFQDDIQGLDVSLLQQVWNSQSDTISLPDQFNWSRLSKLYLRKVRSIVQEDEELRNILNAQLERYRNVRIQCLKKYIRDEYSGNGLIGISDLAKYCNKLEGDIYVDLLELKKQGEIKIIKIYFCPETHCIPNDLVPYCPECDYEYSEAYITIAIFVEPIKIPIKLM